MYKLKFSKYILPAIMVGSWLSLPLLGKKTVRRFLPASLFLSIVVIIESYIAKIRKWWWFLEKIHPRILGEFPLIFGPFLIGSMWILKLTYGNFLKYTILNSIVDSFFTYIFTNWLRKLGIASLIRLTKTQLSLLFFFKSMLLYGFQFLKEKSSSVK